MVILRLISPAAATAILAGGAPGDVRVAAGYPTEFSQGVARAAREGQALGPYFVHRADDDVVVGEIGGSFVAPGTVEIGYAIVELEWGRGHASAAVRALAEEAKRTDGVDRLVAHTPLERPASGRVVAKAGFALAGEEDDEHEGVVTRVQRWEVATDGG